MGSLGLVSITVRQNLPSTDLVSDLSSSGNWYVGVYVLGAETEKKIFA